MDFYEAFYFLAEHRMFRGHFSECLDIMVLRENPAPAPVTVCLECGPYCPEGMADCPWCHDVNLDCYAPTFEEAIIDLAAKVRRRYGDGEPRQPEFKNRQIVL